MKNGLTLFKDPFFDTLDVFERHPFRSSFFDALDSFFEKNNKTYPDIKINKNDEDYQILMSIPGLSKDDLKISTKDGVLIISYEKEEKTKNTYFINSFSKSYSIPENVTEDKIEANVKDGVLEITLPFSEEKSTERVISID